MNFVSVMEKCLHQHVWYRMLQIWQDSSQVSLALINTSVSNSTVASSEGSTASHCLTTWVAR
ncbi:hypothetical protein T10_6608 [Trichinella papuae]|uniref:Uncharacterized protein n=1 Tax=Trichinella papuae TaxID=268474 RepID=A0A0V1MN50_9BILA|nr:hypothetical protein T10_6608 [Trichinella papuae]